ncbi:transporter substrate-binding domain-containing protein [Chitinivorax sp. B]|uniref:substrate-binding periplasmic protein n=1 Tax=Chitinivorax sp. B TaxID=2502235 RepID=UPI0010F7784D|nr:transporter substrate-binding domain-containing protein [Chitinivorax sp. B]
MWGVARLLLIWSLSANAATPRLTLCHEEWEPYAKSDKGGSVGITIELVSQALANLGFQTKFTETSYIRCQRQVMNGEMDGMLFVNADELPAWPHTSVATEHWMIAAWVRDSSSLRSFSTLDVFRGQRVGRAVGYEWPSVLRRQKGWTVVVAGDGRHVLYSLSNGRVDVVFEDTIWGDQVQRRDRLNIRVLLPAVVSEPQVMLFQKKHAALVRDLDRELAKLLTDGSFDQVYRKHTGKDFRTWLQIGQQHGNAGR